MGDPRIVLGFNRRQWPKDLHDLKVQHPYFRNLHVNNRAQLFTVMAIY